MTNKESSTSAASFTSVPTAHTTTTDDPSGLTMEFYGLKELPEMTLDVTRRIEQCFVSCWGDNNSRSRALTILSKAGLKALSVRSDTGVKSENAIRETKPVHPLKTGTRSRDRGQH